MELNECEKQTEETHICVLFFPRHSLSLSPSRPRLHEGRFPLLAFANNPRLRRVDCLSVRRRVSVTGDQFLADSCIIAWGGWPAAPVSSELVHVFASAGKGKDIKEDKKKKLCRSVPLYSRAALKGISLHYQIKHGTRNLPTSRLSGVSASRFLKSLHQRRHLLHSTFSGNSSTFSQQQPAVPSWRRSHLILQIDLMSNGTPNTRQKNEKTKKQ